MHILEMNSDSRPWVTGPQRRNRRHGKVHRNQCWYHRQEQQDSRLIRTRSCPNNRVHLNLLRNAKISRPNQVWAADITYLPMARGFLYLVAIMDWHSRYVVAWRLSNTLMLNT